MQALIFYAWLLSLRMAARFLYEAARVSTSFLFKSEVAQSCPTLCDPMDCSLPGSSVHGIFQAIYWSGLPFPSPWDLPNPGIEPGLLRCRETLYHLSHQGSLFSLSSLKAELEPKPCLEDSHLESNSREQKLGSR